MKNPIKREQSKLVCYAERKNFRLNGKRILTIVALMCAVTFQMNAQMTVEQALKSAEQKAKQADKNPKNGKKQYEAAMMFINDELGEKKDYDRALTYANRAFVAMLGGGDEANVLEKPLSTWFDQAQIVKPALDRAMTGERWSGEGKPANRSDMTVQVSVVPDIDADGVLQAVIVSVTDATLRLRAELAEFQLDRDRAMMESLSEACHAIGQPATVLLTSIEMLRDAPDMDVETRKAIYDMCYSAMMELRQHLQEMNAARLSVKEDLMPSGTKATSGAAFYSGNADAQPNA